MKIYRYPEKDLWGEITSRPRLDLTKLNETVAQVLSDVRQRGDEAIKEYEQKFDHAILDTLAVSKAEMDEAEQLVSRELNEAIILAHHNIHTFHETQRFEGCQVETQPGVKCWQKSVAIERVGLYIPGGTAPLFSTVLMLATPAKIAGCQEIVLCTPPNKEGKVNPAILVAARIAGVSKIFKAGGVQAIGAMAYGTQSVLIEDIEKSIFLHTLTTIFKQDIEVTAFLGFTSGTAADDGHLRSEEHTSELQSR